MGRTAKMREGREGERNPDLEDGDHGVCSGCNKVFLLTEEKKIFDGDTLFWICPFCRTLSDNRYIIKKNEWELDFG